MDPFPGDGREVLIAETSAPERIEFLDVAEPAIEPGHALVSMRAVTLCGTDLHIYRGHFPTSYPIVQGHEMAGIVVDPGGDPALRVGDRVVVDPLVACGTCRACRRGHPNVCPHLSVLGCYENGGLAELLSVPTRRLHRVPDAMPLEIAAMAEPASIALQAVGRAAPEAGEVALVLGCGPIGLLSTLALADLGVTVIAADTDAARATLSRSFGATASLTVEPGFPEGAGLELIGSLTEGVGPEIIIEATGVPASIENAIRIVAPAGRIVQVGISTRAAQFTVKDITDKEIQLRGSRNSLGLIPEGLGLLQRHPAAAAALLTHTFPLARIAEAFATMTDPDIITGKIGILMPVPSDGIAAEEAEHVA